MLEKFIVMILFILSIVLVFGLFIMALKRGSKQYEKENAATFEDVAKSLGLRFEKKDEHGVLQKISRLWLLGRHKTPIENIVFGMMGGNTLYIFEHQEKYSLHDKSIRKWTVFLFELDYSFSCKLAVFGKLNTVAKKLSKYTIGEGLRPIPSRDFDMGSELTAFADAPNVAKQLISQEFESVFLQHEKKVSHPVMFQVVGNLMALNTYESKPLRSPEEMVTMAKLLSQIEPLVRKSVSEGQGRQ